MRREGAQETFSHLNSVIWILFVLLKGSLSFSEWEAVVNCYFEFRQVRMYIAWKKISMAALTLDHINLPLSLFVSFNTSPTRSVQSLSSVQLCEPMDYSTPGFPVHHQLL